MSALMTRPGSWLRMPEMFERLFDENFEDWFPRLEIDGRAFTLALDVTENDNSYLITTALPGVKREDIEIRFQDGALTISAEVKEEAKKEDEHIVLKERRYGHYSRSLRLPAAINADKVEAVYEDGVLKLIIPKVEAAKPRLIPVKAGKK